MANVTPLQGELQTEVMAALWRLGDGTVDEVRQALPEGRRSAYNTVQTVLNRLGERGLLSRRRRGHQILYAPRISEAEYLERALEGTLARASSAARRVALAQLIGALPPEEREELHQLAGDVERERGR